MPNDMTFIASLAFFSLLPFLVASGTCYIKFSIVFVMVRNALGLQQIPSNLTLNGIALILSLFVMSPIVKEIYHGYQEDKINLNNPDSVVDFFDNGLSGYHRYLEKYADPELVRFFNKAQSQGDASQDNGETYSPSILALLPAYALSEIKSAFTIGFYLYLPFIVVDLLVSSILLALGMMMMSPITLSVPIKLIIFVVLDGWTLLSKGLVMQYIDLAS
ncbi:EscR/YscR/HrcR family type III secretion system export apparatus protein [Biostraticola tofi]|uniref:Type III secretion protein R n=1 Tax=Biostraticola tofi TaxID=466109 RepID=A0A4V2W4P6_9GAMM|nr:EscR/YscR/HrcR family type III secretion system export apparatus protein [Biostraticola tofi]TCV96669.1 type III secretion protein R [Biostraticola tofi]